MRHTDVTLDNCLKCSDCNAACPVMTAHPRYPGPKHLGPELEKLRREGLPCDSEWLEYCLGCERCDMACPNQVNVAELIARAKAAHKKPLRRRLRDWLLARPGLLGQVISLAPAVANRVLALGVVRRLMSLTAGIAAERSFPAYARVKLAGVHGRSRGAERVVFFQGCSMRYNEQALGRDCIALLAENGIETEMSEAGCCGYPALANGDPAEARRRVRANLELLYQAAENGTPIVTACTSCGQMLKTGFTLLLGDDPELAAKARVVESAVRDLGEFLIERADQGHLSLRFGDCGHLGRLAYHSPCHQATQGLSRPWFHLLRMVPGIEIEDLNAGCCGMAGTFGFKQEKYPVSLSIGQRLFQAIAQAAPRQVVSECPTCRMQITHGSGVPSVHPATLLVMAYEQRKVVDGGGGGARLAS
ncbi:anaerobic glycerol-3-phosphate dehydrogenase subunit C [Magnetospirillum aberrantis]|uniref:Anaerobic glycerol-3-phosphate dehydrogenase subunit C n=1 Tax=Magnetospirillum aberrantis SpK TaxID=908842 RepID=A0A7C9QVD7_9PROT|nr:anaerobic glycerol-3-phosphate dehydrogenase subunit C [Magnetospirillum aberrantis]NFV81079.1 anaerobic glycerol-3-phosphate dehydrogenase subunit C [Magnetospirillum aberrantis SpK]